MKKQKIPLKNSLILLLTATIWGIAFVAQSEGGDAVGAFTFNATRSLIGALVLVPVIFLLERLNSKSNSCTDNSGTNSTKTNVSKSENTSVSSKEDTRTLIIGGISCGICLCLASNFQQLGICIPLLEKLVLSQPATL